MGGFFRGFNYSYTSFFPSTDFFNFESRATNENEQIIKKSSFLFDRLHTSVHIVVTFFSND